MGIQRMFHGYPHYYTGFCLYTQQLLSVVVVNQFDFILYSLKCK